MKKTLKKLTAIDKEIADKKVELTNTKDPLNGYYMKIGNESERQRNIDEINIELKGLYSTKLGLLDSLSQRINLAKAAISCLEKNLTIKINS